MGYDKNMLKESVDLKELKNAIKGFVSGSTALSILGGTVLGAAAGSGMSILKTKNPEDIESDRKKRFYTAKIKEIENENWLNEIMSIKKKLDSNRITDSERKSLETRYIQLINEQK